MSTRPYRRRVIDINRLREAVKTSTSWRAVALCLELPYPSSYIYQCVRPLCGQYEIDYSHFTGQGWNRGKSFPEKRADIQLYFSNEVPINSHNLKLRLLKDGIKQHRCEKCLNTEWNELPIPIQLHHVDGNSGNNALNNLQILCPNCHAQTSNYCGKQHRRESPALIAVSDDELKKHIPLSRNGAQVLRAVGLSLAQSHYNRINRLMQADPSLQFKAKAIRQKSVKADKPPADPYWRIRPKPHKRKVVWPTKETLETLVWEKPLLTIAKEYGWKSEGSLRKICAQYGVNCPKAGYWNKRAAGQSHEQAIMPPKPKQIVKRLTDEQVIQIGELLVEDKLSIRAIAKRFDTGHQTIMKIRDGVAYKHIPRKLVPPAELASASMD